MKKSIMKIVSLILVLAISFAISVPAFAATKKETTNYISNSHVFLNNEANTPILSNEIIAKADPYIKLNGSGRFYISNIAKLKNILTTEEYSAVKLQLESTNKVLSESDVSLSNISINQKEKSITFFSSGSANSSNFRAISNEGVNKIEWIWFGVRIYLSKTTVQHILDAGVTAGATYLGIQFPGVGTAIALAVSAYLVTEFGTAYVSQPIYIDVGLKFPDLINPTAVGIRGFGFQ